MIDKTQSGTSTNKPKKNNQQQNQPAATPQQVTVKPSEPNYRQQARAAAARASAAAGTGDITTAATNLADAKTAAANIKGKHAKVHSLIQGARQDIKGAKQSAAAKQAAADKAAEEKARADKEAADKAAADAAALTHGNAVTLATKYLNDLGVGNLGITEADISKLVSDYGDDANMISVAIESTQGWKTRFDGLVKMRQSGDAMRLGITTEAQYLELENQYRQVFKDANLSNLITDETGNDITKISDMITKFKNSPNEVKDRIADAQRVVNDTSPEVRAALKDFYNIDSTDLVAYSLNPENMAKDINAKANAAMFAGLARGAGLDIGRTFAETQVQNLYGNADIESRYNLQKSLTAAAETHQGASRLATIEGGTLSAEETIGSALGTDVAATKKINELQSRERARFSGSSAIQQKTLRRGGI